ncbi:ead/Ea22-like family protein [Klebsiella quasipneumoniae]|uniref:ead/Ea22-like family protein n=1 Tax=Klebsiella quasipneumoniae TaxID=1463165 RepID=UPI0024469F0B|nr:ead/Ea22-like family protein [Klebsiella quasipneumoniae]MDH2670271.1 ead/Ea22-like family protein [Klebsiella quasipneumoniae]
MTDITELAQSLKSAAENATLGLWYVDPDFDVCDEDRDFIAELHGGNLENNARFIALANPANIIALVEALEKAQQRISELENYAEAEAVGADRAAEDGVYWMKRCKELESRTVKLPKPINSDQGWKIDPEFINKVQDAIGYDDTCECWEGTPSMELVEAVLLAAAGIKVEAE